MTRNKSSLPHVSRATRCRHLNSPQIQRPPSIACVEVPGMLDTDTNEREKSMTGSEYDTPCILCRTGCSCLAFMNWLVQMIVFVSGQHHFNRNASLATSASLHMKPHRERQARCLRRKRMHGAIAPTIQIELLTLGKICIECQTCELHRLIYKLSYYQFYLIIHDINTPAFVSAFI